MDQHSIMSSQLHALTQQLSWAETALEKAEIKPRIKKAAEIGFAVLFKQRRDELSELQRMISKQGASAHSWVKLGKQSRRCREVFGECLGFLGSALIRSNTQAKDDICEIADALLYELNNNLHWSVNWQGATLLADGNFFTETTGLIRLPFPDYGIWNLPISVHEFGHFIAPHIRDGRGHSPFESFLRSKEEDNLQKEGDDQLSEEELEQQSSHLKELFSDLFAVYSLGPAFACSCILLSFNPADKPTCEDSETHPSYAKRVYFILEVLKQMDRDEGDEPYRKIREHLSELWTTNSKMVGAPCLQTKEAQALNYLLFQLHPIINGNIPTARYKGWTLAVDLYEKFFLKSGPLTALAPNATIADVLNAAWIWRLSLTHETAELVEEGHLRASELCRAIMA